MPTDQHERFHIASREDLREKIAALGVNLPLSENTVVLGDTVAVGARQAPNRMAVHPMEGFDADADGAPTELSFRRYRRYAAGGSGLIWFEATAPLLEARSNPGQLWLHEKTADSFARLVEATRAAAENPAGKKPLLVLQITHSGRYSKPHGIPKPIIAHHSPILDPLHELPADYPLITDDELDRLQDTWIETAELAARAGFDGIDIKSCHRYLMSELLASHTRKGKYGGSFENRTRLLLETLARIHDEVPGVFITTRMSAYDAIPYPYGWGVSETDATQPDLGEPIRLIGLLKEIGVPVLNLSIGNPYYNPHFGRPYDFPVDGFTPPSEHPLYAIARFLGITRQVQEAHPDLPVIGAGYTWLRHLLPYVGAGAVEEGWASMIGQGRNAFAYPDSVNDILRTGRMDSKKTCVTCSACTQIMRDGGRTGCVVRDAEIYGPQYRLGRRFSLSRLKREAERCRDCFEPTCREGCPAHIDIPAFIKAFLNDEIETAYEILRRNNLLPEMCGYVCPSEVQCQGHCVEGIFCQNPIPIRDIQLVVCRIARLKGIIGCRVPDIHSGKRIAVVGGGPTGVAAAVRLIEKGHAVTLYEKAGRLGGTPETTIPDERYGNAEAEVDGILAPAREAGRLRVEHGKALGIDLDLQALRQEFDAVLLAVGLGQGVSLGEAEGAVDALDFLRQVKTGVRQTVPARVAVIGGGNTAMDAAVAARKLGGRDVYLVYRRSFEEMPAWPEERDRFLNIGGHLMILTQPLEYVCDPAGRLEGIKIVRTELGEPDDSGRRRPQPVENSESVLWVDLAIEAIGQGMDQTVKNALADLALTKWNTVQVGGNSQRTSLPDVYAAGDLASGGTTAVQGIAEGMKAADEIDAAFGTNA